MAEDAVIGALAVRIGADVSDLIGGFKKAEKASVGLGTALTATVGAIVAVGSALAVMVKTSANAADEISKLSQKVGVSVESLSALKYSAALADVSLDALGTALKKLSVGMVETQAGTGEAQEAFKALGISVVDSAGKLKPSEKVLEEVADKFAEMEDGAGKTALAMRLFGKAGADMIPMLNEGAKALREQREEARALGAIFGEDTAKGAEQFNDTLTKMGVVVQGVGNRLLAELVPSMNAVATAIIDVAKESEGFKDDIAFLGDVLGDALIIAFQTVAVLVANLAFMFKTAGREIAAMAAQLVALATLDLKGFKAISEAVKEDAERARAELDAFETRVMAIQKPQKPGEFVGPPEPKAKKKPAPALEDKEAKKREEERQKEILEATRRAGEERDRAELKAIELTNKIRERAAEDAKQFYLDNLASEVEIEDAKYADSLARLQQHLDTKAITQEEFEARTEGLTVRHNERLKAIEQKGWSDRQKFTHMGMVAQAQTIFGEMANITAGVAQQNRALFEINKVAGIANAVINAYIGISKTLATYPYPWNIAMAALHGVAAFAQIQAIRSTSFDGGGGAAPSLAGGTPATPVTPVTGGVPPGQEGGGGVRQTIVNLHGDTFGRKQVRALLEEINEENRDGGRIVLVNG